MNRNRSEAMPLALLIPGLDGTGRLYYRQVEALKRRYRVLSWSYGEGDGSTLEDLAGELGKASAGEAPGSVLVVGESFGGMVALAYVLRFPERVRRLMLVNAFPYYRRRVRIRLARLLAPLLSLTAARSIKGAIIERVLEREGILEADRQQYRDIIDTIDLKGYRHRLRLVQEVDLRPQLALVAVPTVLLAGGCDKVVPSLVEARFMAARIPQARVLEFPDAGHALLMTPGVSLAAVDSRQAELGR